LSKIKELRVIKFNNGRGAVLCSGCYKILRAGSEIRPEELKLINGEIKYLPPVYCNSKCENLKK